MNKETLVGPTAAGIAVTADGATVVVANYETDSITAVDVVHRALLAEYDLRPGRINPAQSGVPGGEFPFGVAIAGSHTVYVASTRDREIDVVNLNSGALTVDPDQFNRIIWEGLMGDRPYPATPSGVDLRHSGTPQPESKQITNKDRD